MKSAPASTRADAILGAQRNARTGLSTASPDVSDRRRQPAGADAIGVPLTVPIAPTSAVPDTTVIAIANDKDYPIRADAHVPVDVDVPVYVHVPIDVDVPVYVNIPIHVDISPRVNSIRRC